jgi:hypothetical protein
MRKATTAVDISDLPELVRLAEQVQQSAEPRLLIAGGREVALLSPVRAPRRAGGAKRQRGREPEQDLFGGIIGIGDSAGSPGDPSDVAANKHKYLADVYDARQE